MIYQNILSAKKRGKKLLAILLDPEKVDLESISDSLVNIGNSEVDFIFVGGSTVEEGLTQRLVKSLKRQTSIPIVIFPGHFSQISSHADAILFLSLISGRNPEYLINQHIKAVPLIQNSGLEVIPTGYILIDGGKETSVQKISETLPLSPQEVQEITDTACAGMYMGKKIIYLEAGSGALNPVQSSVIRAVRRNIDIPLIVGGGIRCEKDLVQAYESGADLVVIGTAFEENNRILTKIKKNEHIH
jgi:putative glycerol-1-phosphate prenyltransferase